MADFEVTNTNGSALIRGSLAYEVAHATAGSTITFAADLDGKTIALADTLIINKNLTIEGHLNAQGQPDITIDGQGDFTVMRVNAGKTVTLDGLVIADGKGVGEKGTTASPNGTNVAGGIVNNGTLTVTNSIFSNDIATGGAGVRGKSTNAPGTGGNAAGAILNNGKLTIGNDQFTDDTAHGGRGYGTGAGGSAAGAILNENGSTLVLRGTDDGFTGDHGTVTRGGHVFTTIGALDATIQVEAACYARGTRIRSERGDVAIEALSIGDRVVTQSGALRPVRWIGHRAVDCANHPDPRRVWPVRIAAHAFGDNQPARALWVSPGHNIAVNGVLVAASLLQNGGSVVQQPFPGVEYWHIELDTQDVVFAEGLTAETYLDTGNRTAFVGGGAFLDLHPDFGPADATDTCLPLVTSGPELIRIRQDLMARMDKDAVRSVSDPDLCVLADGQRIAAIQLAPSRFAFVLPGSHASVTLASRSFVPAHRSAQSMDTRSLGVCVNRLQIDGVEIDFDDTQFFGKGWQSMETYGERALRWTDGNASLPADAKLVLVELTGQANYDVAVQNIAPAAIG